ncbi:MAG: hypothetical protein FJ291_16435 [Planctomycetes bacterium]|nr:hypothetical protein [Planctomycetota bacterium]
MSWDAARGTRHGVFILHRVVGEVLAFCRRREPNEALGVLAGRRCQHQGRRYVRVTDWATGGVDASPVHAQLTPQGVVECHVELDERYGPDRRPQIVGLFHSHPFGGEPALSERDLATFGGFPYDAEGNVFVLVNPRTGHFLVFQREKDSRSLFCEAPEGPFREKTPGVFFPLVEQEWVEYAPTAPDGSKR